MPNRTGRLTRGLAGILWAAALCTTPSPVQAGPSPLTPNAIADERQAGAASASPVASTGTLGLPLDITSQTGLSAIIARAREAPTPQERQKAIRALRQPTYHGPEAFRALSAVMSADRNNEVRQAAAIALLDYKRSETLKQIEAFFKAEFGDETRRQVCVALATAPAYAQDPGVTSLLSGLLAEDPSAAVRWAATEGLSARRDLSALGALQRAAAWDQDLIVRAAAAAAYRQLSQPRRIKTPRPNKLQRAPVDAVPGKDPCPPGNGWCACSRPPVKIKPHCVPRADCVHTFFNTFQSQGYSCDWDGETIR